MARTPHIFPFQGIRTGNTIHFEGQILHVSDSGNISKPKDSLWRNLKRAYQLYTPTKIKKTKRTLDIILNSNKYSTSLDKFGYFYINIEVDSSTFNKLNDVQFFLGDKQIFINKHTGTSSIIINKTNFNTGVISDIDDTIIISHSTNNLKRTALVGLKNAHSRKVVGETKELFDILDSKDCQFFYVSNSETNLYLLIKWILRLNKLPEGPIFLKRVRSYRNIFMKKSRKSFQTKYRHKIGRIEDLLINFPLKKFILIGDSSQGDPEIYRYISNKFPERIKAVFIRDITNIKRRNELTEIKNELTSLGIHFNCYSKNINTKEILKTIDF